MKKTREQAVYKALLLLLLLLFLLLSLLLLNETYYSGIETARTLNKQKKVKQVVQQ